jgi:lysozyme family protein
MTIQNFARSDAAVLASEGGYSNRAADPGGPTNLGVTLGTARALHLDVNHDGAVDILDIKALQPADAAKVYKHFYWDACLCDQLPAGLDYAVFDFAVNSGVDRASRYLQHILGVAQDGNIGPKTLAAVALRKPSDLLTTLCDWRLAFLKALPTWKDFGAGWGVRVNSVRATSLVWSATPSVAPPVASAPVVARPQSLLSMIVDLILTLLKGFHK